MRWVSNHAQGSGEMANQTDSNGYKKRHDEKISWDGKRNARFFYPAQVDQHNKEYRTHRNPNTIGEEFRVSRGNLRHTRRNGDSHREDVVRKQRCTGNLGGR